MLEWLHLIYGDIVYSDFTEDLAERLWYVQSSRVREIFNISYFDHLSPYLNKSGRLYPHEYCKYHKLILLQNARKQGTYISFLLFRQLPQICLPSFQSFGIIQVFSKSYTVRSCKLGNRLSHLIRDMDSMTLVCKSVEKLFTHKIMLYYKFCIFQKLYIFPAIAMYTMGMWLCMSISMHLQLISSVIVSIISSIKKY